MDISTSLQKLQHWFKDINGSLTAFSGGVDSSLVLYLSHYFLKDKAIGVIGNSPSLKRSDFEEAKSFCQHFGIQYLVINPEEINNANYASNPINRCYFCKDALYNSMRVLLKSYPEYIILNGTNIDDLGDYRPGLDAAKEKKIRSPLSECGIDKETIRELAKYFKLPNWHKPASPCLSSRIPYGQSVTKEKLKRIELAEEFISKFGFTAVRVRHDNDSARIEVPQSEVGKLLDLDPESLKQILSFGFKQVEVDKEGFVSGKLNRDIGIKTK